MSFASSRVRLTAWYLVMLALGLGVFGVGSWFSATGGDKEPSGDTDHLPVMPRFSLPVLLVSFFLSVALTLRFGRRHAVLDYDFSLAEGPYIPGTATSSNRR
jgi:hypothetical protein